MYKVTTIFERPSGSIPYYMETQLELRNRFSDFTSNSIELLSVTITDETNTKQVTEAFYADEETFNQFIEKYNIEFPNFFADRDAYHESVGITTIRIVTVI